MHADMERAISNHFTSVFGAAAAGGDSLSFPDLGLVPIDLAEQEEGIGADEVWAAIKSMPSDRVPGPDGFNEIFYKTAWPIIKPEIMEAIQAFCAGNNRNFHKLNTALVVLLPKKIGASCPADFRPITMIHSFAKLISKVLALRLASRMNDLVDHNQNAFVQSRSIHDNYKVCVARRSPHPKQEKTNAAAQARHLQGLRHLVVTFPARSASSQGVR
jgi:hypothetical protein